MTRRFIRFLTLGLLCPLLVFKRALSSGPEPAVRCPLAIKAASPALRT